MPFLTSFERDGITQGIAQGKLENSRELIVEILEMRFGNLSEQLKNQINSVKDLEFLKSLCKQAAVITSLENFQQLLTQNQGEN